MFREYAKDRWKRMSKSQKGGALSAGAVLVLTVFIAMAPAVGPAVLRLIPLPLLVPAAASTALSALSADTQEPIITSPDVSIPESEFEALKHTQESFDLAIEFGFNPMIVQVVRNEAAKALAAHTEDDGGAWRFINTERQLSYLFLSIIYAESKGDVDALGDDGRACGLSQIWVTTAQMYREDVTCDQLRTSIQTQVEVSMEHFVNLLTNFDGNYTLAVLAWNRGENRVDSLISMGISPANGYEMRVFRAATERNTLFVE